MEFRPAPGGWGTTSHGQNGRHAAAAEGSRPGRARRPHPRGDPREITSLASTGIPGAEATSITLVRNDKAFTAAYDGEMALAADELQYEQGYGPCMDAGRGGVVLRVDDRHAEQRWPEYVRR